MKQQLKRNTMMEKFIPLKNKMISGPVIRDCRKYHPTNFVEYTAVDDCRIFSTLIRVKCNA